MFQGFPGTLDHEDWAGEATHNNTTSTDFTEISCPPSACGVPPSTCDTLVEFDGICGRLFFWEAKGNGEWLSVSALSRIGLQSERLVHSTLSCVPRLVCRVKKTGQQSRAGHFHSRVCGTSGFIHVCVCDDGAFWGRCCDANCAS